MTNMDDEDTDMLLPDSLRDWRWQLICSLK
jgi:hypothetical protein